jgi:Transposase, Mutator family
MQGRSLRAYGGQARRSGSYDRKLQTTAGEVTLKVPKLRMQTFETAIIERYRRRESLGGGSAKETLKKSSMRGSMYDSKASWKCKGRDFLNEADDIGDGRVRALR